MPDPTIVIDLIEAFRSSKAMFTAVSLGVFDALEGCPASAAALAAELGLHPEACERLLDCCVALGLLAKEGGAYRNREAASAYLVRSSPCTLSGYILYSDTVLYPMWGNLEDAVRHGSHRWKQTFGLEGPLFSHFFRTDEAMATFVAGMHGFGLLSSPRVVEAFDLSGFQHLVDLGGATGHLAVAACQRYAGLRATVFELPGVAALARDFVRRSGLGDRVAVAEGDFFVDPLPPADLFAVGRILHDWSEDKIARLLARIQRVLPAGGALLIAEKLIDQDKSGPLSAHLQSLNMLVCTEGKERSFEEYSTLLHAAGFLQVEGRRTGVPLDAILARIQAES